MHLRLVYDNHGKPLTLANEIGRGGEGYVVGFRDLPTHVAKVYHRPLAPDHAIKLAAMTQLGTQQLLGIAAWPVSTLHESPFGQVIGFMMPRIVDYKPIYELYGPKARLAEFPRADWRFLIHTAVNLAKAFAVVQHHGHVIGDVNEKNILVGHDATIRLIDCDSFQIIADGRRYPCIVGVPTHQPPEIQVANSPLSTIVRTANHDNFGLAVCIFQLLFLGKHPFAGRPLGQAEVTIEKAIQAFAFPYSVSRKVMLARPPGSLQLTAVPCYVADLFERAFGPTGVKDGARPTPREWIEALTKLNSQLRACSQNGSHYYYVNLESCPWCLIEAETQTVLFHIIITTRLGSKFDLALVWAGITAVSPPGPPPALPPIPGSGISVPQSIKSLGKRRRIVASVGIIVTVSLSALSTIITGDSAWMGVLCSLLALVSLIDKMMFGRTVHDAKARLDSARRKYESVKSRLKHEASDAPFHAKRAELERAKDQYQRLPQLRQERLQQLALSGRERALQRFLDNQRIASASISGIGPTRKAILRSYGIETAADVEYGRVIGIPGFGPVLARELVSWRHRVQRMFRWDPRGGPDERDLKSIEQWYDTERQRLEDVLSQGAAELAQIADQIKRRRGALEGEATVAARAVAEATQIREALRIWPGL